MKKILISFLTLLTSAAMFAADKVYDTNFALSANGTVAYASSGTAANAIDGNNGSRWESASSDPQWFVLNMGQQRIFNTIQIRWEGAYSKTFTIEASTDSTNWTEIVNQSRTLSAPGNYEEQFTFAETTAQYIRFNSTERGTGYGNSFWEFRVLLPGVSTLTTLTATPANPLCKVGSADAITLTAKDQNGSSMDPGDVTYTITPADAGTVANGAYTPAKAGNATIVAKAGDVEAASFSVFAYAGDNLILSSSLATSKIIAQTAVNPNGSAYDAFFAIDSNEGSVWQGDTLGGTSDLDRTCSFTADLGAYYDIELVTIKFEGACSDAYTLDFSADNAAWANALTYAKTNGINAHTDYIYPGASLDLQNNNKVRYVRFTSTKNATQWGMKMFDMKVIGIAWVAPSDAEKPVMGTATFVSDTYSTAVISVAATDNVEIKDFHVVDAANSLDTYKTAVDGKITLTGLTASTTYNVTITARDLALNESDNSASVSFTTGAHLTAPATAAPVPTVPANRVIKVFSDAYTGAEFSAHEGWGDATVYEAMAIAGDNIRLYSNLNWLGWQGSALNCLNMEKLHIDIWAEADGQIGIVPIYGGTGLTTDDSHRKIVSLVGQQWNSLDLDLATDFAGLNLASIYQIKYDNAQGAHFAIDNVYFYRTSDLIDTEAPQNLTATAGDASYFHGNITANATDNMGAVTYTVYNGTDVVATKSAASGETTNLEISNLLPNTTYNLSVVASDANENKTEAVIVTMTTLAAPAAATAPTHEAEDVVSLYCDAYTFAPASLKSYNEGWWAAPSMEAGELTTGEHVLFYYGATTDGMIGWEYGAIDVTAYPNVHVDIYPTAAGTIQVGPTMALSEQTLVANQWNSIDIDLSAVDASNMAGMFQFEFINYYTLGSFFVDNVYFWKDKATSLENIDMDASADAQKVMINGTMYILRGGHTFTAQGQLVK